jgi:monofunctional glycosyltransferase
MKTALRFLALFLVAGLGLQLYFVARIALMTVVAPQSTSFERSQAYAIALDKYSLSAPPPWRQEWLDYEDISNHLKRAVIAAEDAQFTDHEGVDWEAIEKAWERNAKIEAALEKNQARLAAKKTEAAQAAIAKPRKVVGGSTITQQLAKNLFLSGERTLLRKGQELVLAYALELLLDKRRILEIYLNNVEWGEGVFGAEGAAQHYFRKSAKNLTAYEAARLAVMLPRPKFFEKRPRSAYVSGRASTIAARMGSVEIP